MKCGVPPTILSIIQSFHEGMEASVRMRIGVTDSFQVRNGLRQDCTMAPTLFNLYFNQMVSVWHEQCFTLSILKTKGLAIGTVKEGNISLVEVGSGMIEMVKNLTYLSSNLSSDYEATLRSSVRLPKLQKLLVSLENQL